MKINTSTINDEGIQKELSIVQGNPWEYQDVSTGTQRGPVTPKLLTSLLGGTSETGMTNVFQYDEETDTAQLPSGKPYDQKGKDLPKDSAKMKYFGIPSFGLRLNVAPKDYANRRKPHSTELMDEAYLVAKMTTKADKAFMLNDELAFAELLTADTNRVAGGPFSVYNYYTDIVGSARPAKVSMELDQSSADHISLLREQKKELLTSLAKYGDSSNGIVVICGDTFFTQRLEIERNTSLGRDLRGAQDFASMEVLMSDFGSQTFQYDWFKGDQDGLIYINYGAEIISGNKLIADVDAYMIPAGVDNFMGVAYAPAQTRTYVNTEALNRYSWMKTDDFQGVTIFMEENKLFFDKKPDLIRNLINT